MLRNLLPILSFSKWSHGLLALLACTCFCCDTITDPPELIRKYEPVWEHKVLDDVMYPSAYSYITSLRQAPDGTILITAAVPSLSGADTHFVKLDADGNLVAEATFPIYAGTPLITSTGDILSLSDSLRRFSPSLKRISAQVNRIQRFGVLALTEESMLFADYAAFQMALTAYDFDGKAIWSKPASLMGCGGNFMAVEPLGQYAGMVSRSSVADADTLRFSVFRLEDGDMVWSGTYPGRKVFPVPVFPRLQWMDNGNGAWVMGGDGAADKIYLGYVSAEGITRRFTVDVTNHPFVGLVDGFRTVDNGFLFGLNGDFSTDAFSYRLVKTDSRGNVGWVGTITIPGTNYLTDLMELSDGTVIAVTGFGIVTAYRPVY